MKKSVNKLNKAEEIVLIAIFAAKSGFAEKKMKKLVDNLNKAEEIVLVAMFAAMVAIIFMQVIMRYVFQNSLSWSEELGKFLFIWISWIGISIGERRLEHIKISLIVDKFGNKGQHIFNIISEIIVITICAVTFYYGIKMVIMQAGTRYAGIKISVSWGYLSVVVGCGLMMIRAIGMCVLSGKGIKTGQSLHELVFGSDDSTEMITEGAEI